MGSSCRQQSSAVTRRGQRARMASRSRRSAAGGAGAMGPNAISPWEIRSLADRRANVIVSPPPCSSMSMVCAAGLPLPFATRRSGLVQDTRRIAVGWPRPGGPRRHERVRATRPPAARCRSRSGGLPERTVASQSNPVRRCRCGGRCGHRRRRLWHPVGFPRKRISRKRHAPRPAVPPEQLPFNLAPGHPDFGDRARVAGGQRVSQSFLGALGRATPYRAPQWLLADAVRKGFEPANQGCRVSHQEGNPRLHCLAANLQRVGNVRQRGATEVLPATPVDGRRRMGPARRAATEASGSSYDKSDGLTSASSSRLRHSARSPTDAGSNPKSRKLRSLLTSSSLTCATCATSRKTNGSIVFAKAFVGVGVFRRDVPGKAPG